MRRRIITAIMRAMIRSPSSASAISRARTFSGGITRASNAPSALPSTSDERRDRAPISARNWPGPCRTTGVMRPRPSRWLICAWPCSTMYIPAAGLPVSNSTSPSLKLRTSPKWRSRSISRAVSEGKVSWWRGCMAEREAPPSRSSSWASGSSTSSMLVLT